MNVSASTYVVQVTYLRMGIEIKEQHRKRTVLLVD